MQISQMFAAVALLSVFAADATAPAAPASIANLATNPANTDAHLKSVAGALTDLLKTNGANQASNTSDIVKTIKDLLEKNMKGHVIGNFNKSLAAIESSRNEFVKCRLTYAKSDPVRFPATSLLQANGTNSTPWYEAYFQAYSQCKAWEGQVAADLTACDYSCTSEVKIMGENCTNLGLECGPLDCTPVSGEGYKAFLDRMISEIKTQIDVLTLARSGPGRYNLTHRCTDILGTAERCFKDCHGHIEEIVPKAASDIPGCCAPRTQAEDAKCKELGDQRTAWEEYDACYDAAEPQWETTKAEEIAGESALQAQMRSILRMLCYIDSFGEDQAAKLNQCVENDYTKHPEVLALTIEPGVPEAKLSAFACNASETPGTAEFDELHYAHLPTGLASCPQLHCQDICGFVNIKAMNASTSTVAPLVEKTTVKSQCFKKADSQSAVFWDLGSAQNIGTVSANPSAGVASIKVYLTSSGPGEALASSSMCGTSTHTSNSVECSSKGSGRYLAMEPFVDGTCVFGSCTQSWCLLQVDGSAMTQEPVASTGSSYMGEVVVNANTTA